MRWSSSCSASALQRSRACTNTLSNGAESRTKVNLHTLAKPQNTDFQHLAPPTRQHNAPRAKVSLDRQREFKMTESDKVGCVDGGWSCAMGAGCEPGAKAGNERDGIPDSQRRRQQHPALEKENSSQVIPVIRLTQTTSKYNATAISNTRRARIERGSSIPNDVWRESGRMVGLWLKWARSGTSGRVWDRKKPLRDYQQDFRRTSTNGTHLPRTRRQPRKRAYRINLLRLSARLSAHENERAHSPQRRQSRNTHAMDA
ncbi:hypothetical protein DFP72DRAFT_136235 [Ephemerocybe angulata]|uniref:Uncharacterized protein n=1 Tax=Ephemerocybe angulata TaxID=980116 RepID=A0A8H6I677_9AGAR|nr:hypothetical protein DFP72DRAFT_136235 [Tulosesus angulatus]